MKYVNENVRRQDRLLEEKEAFGLLRLGEFGVLSMVEVGEEAGGYGIPISYAWDGKDSIYFHCAPKGHKINCLEQNPNASFCVVGRTNVISNKFTTEYESIILRGTVSTELSDDERTKGLVLILEKYCPDNRETGLKYIEKSFDRTGVIRLDISTISGKTKRVMP